jgi:hypothetical protein
MRYQLVTARYRREAAVRTGDPGETSNLSVIPAESTRFPRIPGETSNAGVIPGKAKRIPRNPGDSVEGVRGRGRRRASQRREVHESMSALLHAYKG